MTKGRLEAYSDAVLAIIVTIMVLELKVPHGADWAALRGLLPELSTYVLSFVYLGIYWNNHHHMMHATTRINGAVLWANQHLLFWLSLVPFVTGWMGETHLAPLPTALYAVDMLMAAIAYTLLSRAIVRCEGPDSRLARAIGGDVKGKVSLGAYTLAIPLAFLNGWISVGIFVTVATMWLIPDRRIEARLES